MRKHICLFLAIIMAFMLMPLSTQNAYAETHVESVSVSVNRYPNISLGMSGSEASLLLYDTFMESDCSEGALVDPNDCYLAYRDGDEFVSLQDSDDPLEADRFYYYCINVIAESG